MSSIAGSSSSRPPRKSPATRAPQLDKLALFADLGYEPHPGQIAVHLSTASRRVLACGVRWGKSTCAVMEAIAAAMEPREQSKGWIVGPRYDVSSLLFRLAQEVLEKHLPHRIEEVVPREHRLVIRNLGGGVSEVRAKSAEHAVSLLGEGLDWLILDEAARVKESVWEGHLSQRLIDRDGWALLLSTPRGKANWFYGEYRRGQGRDPGYESWRAPSHANPHLDAAVILRERDRLRPDVFRQEYGAVFLGLGMDRCDTCGDPDPAAAGLVILAAEVELSTCQACGQPVDGDGRAMRTVLEGRPAFHVIRLHEGACPESGGDWLRGGEEAAPTTH